MRQRTLHIRTMPTFLSVVLANGERQTVSSGKITVCGFGQSQNITHGTEEVTYKTQDLRRQNIITFEPPCF